ncbi:CRISPR-associated protein Cas5 [Syntrophorhabdus aromaticivorans]|uniref:CRISPR-associated protein Cas5 n=1 Tax=Syntrophorhabdus aromaticivorans TaxID=328301 RepID=UPI00048FCFF3|nr:CRISPR-associated protein Cas5 [Syntrophorhabdus aromaticivorans]
MSEYEVALEIAGPAAMFTRPDTGSAPISYPVPTASAARGIFDAVLRRAHIYVRPTKVVLCSPIRYERYVTNYGGPLRSQGQIRDNNNYQLTATILVDVCYRLYGEVKMKQMSTRTRKASQLRRRRGQDWRPLFKSLFEERLRLGQTFYTPCLGWKEFVPFYVGPFRDTTARYEQADDIVISSFLSSMWENRQLRPEFVQDWRIIKGVLSYIHQTPTEDELNA